AGRHGTGRHEAGRGREAGRGCEADGRRDRSEDGQSGRQVARALAVTKLLQTLVNSVALGSLYALTALGYTLVYGVLRFINFAHSDVFTVGAWASFALA